MVLIFKLQLIIITNYPEVALLKRFHEAQKGNPGYEQALKEIRQGRKTSHWIWYILPQLKILGKSSNAQFYGITDFNEACNYLKDRVLFDHYNQMVQLIEAQLNKGISINVLMGSDIDASKLASSLTLFCSIATYLASTEVNSAHDFVELADSCNRILDTIALQGYLRCQKTQSFIEHELKIQSTSLENYRASVGLTDPLEKNADFEGVFAGNLTHYDDHSKIIEKLTNYISERENEWEFHYNFLGIISVIYLIQDFFSGSDHFNSKSREVKISAATKLKNVLESPYSEEVDFTTSELSAIKDGRLGTIVAEGGGLDNLLKVAPVSSSEVSFRA